MQVNIEVIRRSCFFSFVFLLIAIPIYSSTFLDTVRQTWTRDYNQLKGWSSPFGNNVVVLDTNSKVNCALEHPFDVVLRRSLALVNCLKEMSGTPDLSNAETQLQALKSQASSGGNKDTLYYAARSILRRVALRSNPLLNFDRILFVERGICGDQEIQGRHFCDQNFGHTNMGGGGLLVLTNAFTDTPRVVDLLNGSVVQNGRLAGRSLNGGAFKSPELSFDGNTIYFAWSSGCSSRPGPGVWPWPKEICFHLFRVDANGGNLRQLTDSCYDDFDPCVLPNGRVAFISTRRQGYGRCHGRPVPTYTLYSMKSDGSDIICLSYHETNEFEPSVDKNGMIIYTRWDYVDRDAVIAHHLWICTPDGRDPRAPHGNYPLPSQTIFPPFLREGGIEARPMSEFNFRSIPGSTRYVCVAGPHHGEHYGSVILVDKEIEDDGKLSQVTVVTPETGFPEAGVDRYNTVDYGSPWPLSEDFYLVSYKDSGLYYLDRFGNRELLCAKTRGLRAQYPIPLCLRDTPPSISPMTWQGERSNAPEHKRATLTIKNVMISDIPWDTANWASKRKIKWLRIVQFFSKTTPLANTSLVMSCYDPLLAYRDQQEPRMSLGLVPVEADGSVNCEAPVGKSIYFQLLDSNFMAVQSMRSVTYVHAGEQLTCTGCHETKWNTPSVSPNTLASKRRPSKLMPEVDGLEPLTYYRIVKPIFDNKCMRCHRTLHQGPQDMTYFALEPYAFFYAGGQGNLYNPMVGGSRTLPGYFGASYSRMGKALMDSVHQSVVTAEDRRRVFLWLDLLSNQYGDFFNLDKQAAGERVWPRMDMDSTNPQGVEWDYPLANYTLDATPPSVPSGLQTQLFENTGISRSILLKWQASQDAESGVWAYRIYRNGVSHAYTCSTSFKDSYLKEGEDYIYDSEDYVYQVTAINIDNRESGRSPSVPTPPDTSPPVLKNIITDDSKTILLVFNKKLDKSSAETSANYRLDNGISVVNAVLDSDTSSVMLSISLSLSAGVTYTLSLGGIKDRFGNSIPANTQTTFTGSITTVDSNFAYRATATASSTQGGAEYNVNNVNDGIATTDFNSWASTSTPAWVQIDFGAKVIFNRVVLYTTTGYELKDYIIQYWDGMSWIDAASVTGNTQAHRTTEFSPVTCTKMRVYATTGSAAQSNYARICELEIYNGSGGTGLEIETARPVPLFFGLAAVPNPFAASTLVKFDVPQAKNGEKQKVSVRIYDLSGRLVQTLAQGAFAAGYHTAVFNVRENGNGRTLGNGIYFCRMQAPGFARTIRLLLVQ